MKQSLKVIIWVAVFILVLGGAYFGYRVLKAEYALNQPSSSSSLEEITPAEDFVVYDAEGNEIKLSSKFGKPIVLNFWATWCSPCRIELPDFNKVYQEFGDEVEFIMVNTDGPGTEADVKTFLAENGYAFPVYYDTDYNGIRAYNITGIPVTYFINTDGSIVIMATQYGTIQEDDLRERIDRILN